VVGLSLKIVLPIIFRFIFLENFMHLIIDGYNLLHVDRPKIFLNSVELQWERDQLIERLSAFRHTKPCEITIVFDGWQGGRTTECRERRKGIDLIFTKLGEKADEVIKRLVKERGSGVIVITSDRDISRYVEGMAVTVISSDQFMEKMKTPRLLNEKPLEEEDEEERRRAKKGPSKKLSKKERRVKAILRKL